MAAKTIFMALIPILILHLSLLAKGDGSVVVYDVQSFGARSDGGSDCTQSFLSAWAAACGSVQSATIYVPPGRYLIGTSVTFLGQSCNNSGITLRIDGTLVAPSDYNVVGRSDNWIKFERTTGLTIYGGTLDGQGTRLWGCKRNGKNCPGGATSLGISRSKNVTVRGLTSLNSQFYHIIVESCFNIKLVGITISAPADSPNTDGIHVQSSSGVTILNSNIGTGDDCISLGPGSSSVHAESINCGPGHGISIGSLGFDLNQAGVQNVTLKTATFRGTTNGVRMKTWANPKRHGFVRGVLFQNATMINVKNPIIIDQTYCPHDGKSCQGEEGFGIEISEVTYQDIHGTSATKIAVNFDCSKTYPCRGIVLQDVNLSYGNKPAMASCVNAYGSSVGLVNPRSCL